MKCGHHDFILNADNLVAAPDVGTRSRASKGRATFGVTKTLRVGPLFLFFRSQSKVTSMNTNLSKPSGSISPDAIAALRKVLEDLKSKSPSNQIWNPGNFDQMVAAKAAVIPRYGPAFSPANVGKLSRETFLGFLQFENNRHWRGLDRLGDKLTKDMNHLREALALLVDEAKPLRNRLEQLRPRGGKAFVPFLGPAVMTAILHVVYPDRYTVLNETLKRQ